MTRQFRLNFIPRRMYVGGNYTNDYLLISQWQRRKIVLVFKALAKEYMTTGTSREGACYLARVDVTDLLWAGKQYNTEHIIPVGK